MSLGVQSPESEEFRVLSFVRPFPYCDMHSREPVLEAELDS